MFASLSSSRPFPVLLFNAQVIQNLANDVNFGQKESYLIPMNEFIDAHKQSMKVHVVTWDALRIGRIGRFSFLHLPHLALVSPQECMARLCMLPSSTDDAKLLLIPAPRCLASLNRILLDNEEALLR